MLTRKRILIITNAENQSIAQRDKSQKSSVWFDKLQRRAGLCPKKKDLSTEMG